ncbi:hypothetical protein [Paraburkholderia sediminicola]|uniref:hypothetical protein n=1 Tax=Paraburkholderia sediminicola TaxID=458836 RepID=UPI0038BCF1FC
MGVTVTKAVNNPVPNINPAANGATQGTQAGSESGSITEPNGKLTGSQLLLLAYALIEKLVELERQASADSTVQQVRGQSDALSSQERGIAAQKFSTILNSALQATGGLIGGAGGAAGAVGGAIGGSAQILETARLGFDGGQAAGGVATGLGGIKSAKEEAISQSDQAQATREQSLTEVDGKQSDSVAQSAASQIQAEQSLAQGLQQAQAQAGAAVAQKIGS